MVNYIKEIKVPKLSGGKTIVPAYPLPDGQHVINVLCVPNNSGKSFIFRAIDAILSRKTASGSYHGYEVIFHADDCPPKFFSSVHVRFKESAGIISRKHGRIDPNKKSDFRNFSLQFFFDQINDTKELTSLLAKCFPLSNKKWVEDHEYRNSILETFPIDESVLYSCNRSNEVVSFLEKSLGVTLAFRRPKENIEVTLINPSGVIVPYPEWSDGQKTLFYIALCVSYWKPEVLLIDELENHLHPLFMTKALQFIKQNVPQTFIATHHPHIIFSNFVDKVFYIEVKESEEHFAKFAAYKKIAKQHTPPRELSSLEDSFTKLSATYKLFDNQDYQLLKQANRISSYCDIVFYMELLKSFSVDLVPPSIKPLPDRQSLDIASLIHSEHSGKDLTVLDFGAGLGRVIVEISKLTEWQFPKELKWICWEPFQRPREKLRELLIRRNKEIMIPDTLDDVEESTCDVVVIANVLHELTPTLASEVLHNSYKKLKKETGTILISEIYPLLHAEKFAVAYSEPDLNRILRSVGFVCSSRGFPVLDASAYCLSARPIRQYVLPVDEIQKTIENAWNEIKANALSSYSARSGGEISSTIEILFRISQP